MGFTKRNAGGHLGAAAVAAIVAAGGCGGGTSDGAVSTPSVAANSASVAGYRVLEPGAFIAGFPADPLDMQSELLIEYGWDLAIGVGPDEIYILDMFAKHVLRLDQDANLRAIIGGPGAGPGEFEDPHSIEADPRGGVWVADFRLARMSRFDADGNLLEELRVPEMVRGFAVLPDGAVLYRKFDRQGISLTVQSGEDAVDLAGELPPELAPDDFRSLWAEYDLEFAVVAPDTVVAFRNTDVKAYGAWRIALDIAAGRIMDIEPVAFPAWLVQRRRRRRRGDRAGGRVYPDHPLLARRADGIGWSLGSARLHRAPDARDDDSAVGRRLCFRRCALARATRLRLFRTGLRPRRRAAGGTLHERGTGL